MSPDSSTRPPRRVVPTTLLVASLAGLAAFGAVSLLSFTRAADEAAHAALDRQWEVMRAYLRIEPGGVTGQPVLNWYYNVDDADQTFAVARIRERLRISDERGRLLAQSVRPPDPDGRLLVRTGLVPHTENRARYRVAIAAPAVGVRHRTRAFYSLAAAFASAVLLGWSLARVAPAWATVWRPRLRMRRLP